MNLAYQSDQFYEPRDRGTTSADKYLLADRKFARRRPAVFTVETGIEEVGEIEIRSSKAPSEVLLEQLGLAVSRLTELRSLESGWDSYEAPRVRSSAFEPATKIVLNAILRCHPPRLEANSGGGIDLIWEAPNSSLIISAMGEEAFEVILTEPGEIVAPDEPVGMAQAHQFLDRFCASL